MSKPSAEVHVGRLSVPLQSLMFSVTDVLKSACNCESIASLLSVFPEENKLSLLELEFLYSTEINTYDFFLNVKKLPGDSH